MTLLWRLTGVSQVNLDSETRELLMDLMETPTAETFNEAQHRIFSLMAEDSFPRFLRSTYSQHLLKALWDKTRLKPTYHLVKNVFHYLNCPYRCTDHRRVWCSCVNVNVRNVFHRNFVFAVFMRTVQMFYLKSWSFNKISFFKRDMSALQCKCYNILTCLAYEGHTQIWKAEHRKGK